MRKHWAQMSPAEREARIAFLTGMWTPDARVRMSNMMQANWDEYKRSARYQELLAALRASARE